MCGPPSRHYKATKQCSQVNLITAIGLNTFKYLFPSHPSVIPLSQLLKISIWSKKLIHLPVLNPFNKHPRKKKKRLDRDSHHTQPFLSHATDDTCSRETHTSDRAKWWWVFSDPQWWDTSIPEKTNEHGSPLKINGWLEDVFILLKVRPF